MSRPYVRLDYADETLEIGEGTALIQAAQALDTAASIAVKSQDKDTLLSVAAGWMNFAQVLAGLHAPPAEEDKEEPQDLEVGFRVPTTGSISIEPSDDEE